VGRGITWPHRDRTPQALRRFAAAAELVQGQGEIIVGLDVIRLGGDGAAMALYRLVEAPLRLQRRAEIVVGFGVIGFQRDRAAIALDRLGHAVLPEQRDTQMIVRVGVIRVGLGGTAVARLRLGEIPPAAQHQPEIVMRHREAGIDGNRLADQSDPGVAIVFLIANASRKMQGIAMRRIGGQDLLVTLRGGVELTRLVMFDRALQDLFNVVRHGSFLRELSICLSCRLFAAPIRIAYG